jgi:hypothetical protein
MSNTPPQKKPKLGRPQKKQRKRASKALLDLTYGDADAVILHDEAMQDESHITFYLETIQDETNPFPPPRKAKIGLDYSEVIGKEVIERIKKGDDRFFRDLANVIEKRIHSDDRNEAILRAVMELTKTKGHTETVEVSFDDFCELLRQHKAPDEYIEKLYYRKDDTEKKKRADLRKSLKTYGIKLGDMPTDR